MSDTKISALPAASSALGADELPINEAGTSKKLTVTQIQAYTFGAAFPTGAALTAYGNNHPFFRTDLGEWYYYDGTRWLSSTLHFISGSTTTWATDPFQVAPWGLFDMWIVDLSGRGYGNNPQNGSNYRRMGLNSYDAGALVSLGFITTLNGPSGGAWWTLQRLAIGAVVTKDKMLQMWFDAIGSPGVITGYFVISYRTIAV